MWFRATASTQRALRELAHLKANEIGWSARTFRQNPGIQKHGTAGTADLAVELASISSELALGLLSCPDPAWSRTLPAAIHHLSRVLEFVPEKHRLSFLFQCWQTWSNTLEPARRVAVGAFADMDAGRATKIIESVRVAESTAAHWTSYDSALAETLSDNAIPNGTPVNYLLFEHAHLTNNRLGIDTETEARAARTLRSALVSGISLESLTTPAGQADTQVFQAV